MKFWIQTLIALFLTVTFLSGCNKTDESAPATDEAVTTTEPAAPADNAAAPAAEEPATQELGGWSPPPEDAAAPTEDATAAPAEEPMTTTE
jgi:hypothetical protein